MALLHDSVEFKKLDVRLIERNLARGTLSPQQVKDAVAALPDDAENAEWISLDTLAYDGALPENHSGENSHSS